MLISLMLTRFAKDGSVVFCPCFKRSRPGKTAVEAEESEGERRGKHRTREAPIQLTAGDSTPGETKPDVSVIDPGDLEGQTQLLRKVVHFLQSLQEKQRQSERFERRANTVDNIVFWIYFVLGTIYFIAMISVMVKYKCKVNHFDFWY